MQVNNNKSNQTFGISISPTLKDALENKMYTTYGLGTIKQQIKPGILKRIEDLKDIADDSFELTLNKPYGSKKNEFVLQHKKFGQTFGITISEIGKNVITKFLYMPDDILDKSAKLIDFVTSERNEPVFLNDGIKLSPKLKNVLNKENEQSSKYKNLLEYKIGTLETNADSDFELDVVSKNKKTVFLVKSKLKELKRFVELTLPAKDILLEFLKLTPFEISLEKNKLLKQFPRLHRRTTSK